MIDMAPWTGRIDADDAGDARRWHQVVQPWQRGAGAARGIAVAGFACDAGIARNQGRVGAAAGPAALRRVLANFAWHAGAARGAAAPPRPDGVALYDAGDVVCADGNLEAAQSRFAALVAALLASKQLPILLGGGHEIAWASYQGLAQHAAARGARIGVINFDAHFDLRPLLAGNLGTSGTPFRQIAEHMRAGGQAVRYLALGIARPANTAALYETAAGFGVDWIEDIACCGPLSAAHRDRIRAFVDSVDLVQLSICLDVFPAGLAPGVSAPAGLGVAPTWVLEAVRQVPQNKLALVEIAELNPGLDLSGSTARLGARLAFEIVQTVLADRAATPYI